MKLNSIYKNKKISAEAEKKFETFYNFLIDYNKKINLTAITNEKDVYEKHFFDSIQCEDVIPKNASVIDIGAGAGFPSVPLKIIRDDIKITMVDGLNKRIKYLNELTEKLELTDITTIHSRAEDLAIKSEFREQYDVAVARAVAGLSTLLEYLSPFVKIGGKIIAFKGVNYKEETDDAKSAEKLLGLKFDKVIEYELPYSGLKRALVIYEKVSNLDKKYPRGGNKPKSEPL